MGSSFERNETMPELYLHLLAFCLAVSMVLLSWLCVFSLSEPLEFARWLRPYDLIVNRWFRVESEALDRGVAFGCFVLFFFLLLIQSALMGGWVTTILFQLWSSPFSRFLMWI